ncbi:MAG: ABC transporter permease [Actinobacteria bacterium]|nr:ABC transporter permease [Actinomycetota bacterium]
MKPFTIAWVNLKRLFRDRSTYFFVFIFPLALILLIGLQFGGDFLPQVGVLATEEGTTATGIVDALEAEPGLEVVPLRTEAELVDQVERGNLDAALTIPAGLDQSLAAGQPAELGFIARPGGTGAALAPVVGEVVQRSVLAANAAAFVSVQGLGDFPTSVALAQQVENGIPAAEVTEETVGESLFPASLGRFDLGASSQLILFMFITALSGGAVLIQTRQFGLSRRMLSTPTSVTTIIGGEALGRFAVVALQGIYIMIGALLIFGVDWGDPVAAIAIVLVFSAVGAGAAMVIGTLFRNAEQAAGVGIMVGLGMAALGGAMLPLQLFSPTLQRIAHFTPHAWASDAFAKIRDRGNIIDIAPELGVLAAYAVVLILFASWRLRVAITRP